MRVYAFVVLASVVSAGCQNAQFGYVAVKPWWNPSGPSHPQDGFISQEGNATPVYTPGSHPAPHVVNQGQFYSNGPQYSANPGGYQAFGGGPQIGPPMAAQQASFGNRYHSAMPRAQQFQPRRASFQPTPAPNFRPQGLSSRQCTTSG